MDAAALVVVPPPVTPAQCIVRSEAATAYFKEAEEQAPQSIFPYDLQVPQQSLFAPRKQYYQ
jgi:hypothetical protein